ncbi:MAG: hypothetical protein K6B40_05300 [Firmicutes bacterium]|nr:hypothetical protein [Bacillota bacterium]
MILEEQVSEMCVRHYSDAGYMLRQVETDKLYSDAVDVIPCVFTYEETDQLIPDEDIDAEESLQILMGGEV